MSAEPEFLKTSGRVLSTLEEDGSRRWLFPRLAVGRFWHGRRAIAYLLIAVYTLLPFLKINGKPAILLDVMHRRFTLIGFTFLPTDTILLALSALTIILLIFLTTALLGRVWCGWACPQTVYLEFLFRPIERLFLGRVGVGGKPRADVAGWRYVAMYAVYAVLSLHLANTFLSYFVGAGTLHTWILGSPLSHPAGFIIVVAVTLLMLFNFGFFREQTCLIACPYGRLQSVLLDRSSLIISYDRTRGEPRGKKERQKNESLKSEIRSLNNEADSAHSNFKRPTSDVNLSPFVLQPASSPSKGDCIDCGLCVAVCPTGIDIRDGLQFECVGCAQCIDICDDVMAKVDRPKGLIRYGSQAGMAGEKPRLLRPRVIVYPLIILLLGSLLTYLLLSRTATDVIILRAPGQPFLISPSGEVTNVLRVKLTNRTDEPQRLVIAVEGPTNLKSITSQPVISMAPDETWTESVEVMAEGNAFRGVGSIGVTVRVSSADKTAAIQIERPFKLLGPVSPLATATSPATTTGAHP